MPGLMEGFAQGYGLVNGIQRQRKQDELEQQRYADQQAYRQDVLEMEREGIQYDRGRDEVMDERWQKEFKAGREDARATQAYRRGSLGIRAANARTSARRNDLQAQKQLIEIHQAQREQREADRRRALKAGAMELGSNGATPRFRSLMKAADVPIDRFDDPGFQKSKETVIAGLNGAPIEHSKMVSAAGDLYQHRIDRVVGGKTPDGREIVRAELDDFIPDEDGEAVRLDLKVWAKDDKGNVEEYNAPVTTGRGSDDAYVMDVPIDEAVGYIKGLDVLDKAVPRQQLANTIDQELTLSGGNESGEDEYWLRGPGNTIINRKTGQSKTIPVERDNKKRYSKALEYARGDFEEDRSYDRLDPEDQRRALIERRDMYLQMMAPDTKGGDLVIEGDPRYGDVTEDDIQTTMRETGMSRAQVMERLQDNG